MLPFGALHEFGKIPPFLAGLVLMAAGFLLAVRFGIPSPVLFWIAAIAARAILLWQIPGADIHRYIWEGRILWEGWNPYIHAPDADVLVHLRDGVWDSVQHRAYSAIYPPLAEWIFAMVSAVSSSPFALKFIFAMADLAVAALLVRSFGFRAALIYAWNPIVIYSFAGGGHYDSLFVLAVVAGWMLFRCGRLLWAAAAVGAAIAIKWMALPLLVWMVWRSLRESGIRIGLMVGVVGAVPLVAAWTAIGLWTGEWTLQLLPPRFSEHARSAEWIPAMAEWLWPRSAYSNKWIVLPLAIAWGITILVARKFETAAQWTFFFTLILTPMVHFWYFAWMVPFAVMTRNLGTLAVSVSGAVYFVLYHRVESPGGEWSLTIPETLWLWLPFTIGFLWSEWVRLGMSDRKKE